MERINTLGEQDAAPNAQVPQRARWREVGAELIVWVRTLLSASVYAATNQT